MNNLIETKQSVLKLIKEAEEQFAGTGKALLDIEDYVAEYLAANGVIVPPCKVGDKVYKIMTSFGYVRECKVVGFHLGKFPTLRGIKRKEYFVCYSDHYLYHIPFDDIGKTVFLSREDAEKALEERKNN